MQFLAFGTRCTMRNLFLSGENALEMLVGIDEAGRGPVIGPLVVCAAGCDDGNTLDSLHLRDSKRLTRKRRTELAELLLSVVECTTLEIAAKEIDVQRCTRTLNDLEAELFARSLQPFPRASHVIVDACDVKPARFGEKVCQYAGIPRVTSVHKADVTYPIVSAASILAKVRRDARIEELKEAYGDFGSGYPSDKRTRDFLIDYIKKEGKLPPIARSSWRTSQRLLGEYENRRQRSLNHFL